MTHRAARISAACFNYQGPGTSVCVTDTEIHGDVSISCEYDQVRWVDNRFEMEITMEYPGQAGTARSRTEQIPSGQITLEGELNVPEAATGVVLFVHGSGSSRHSPRNQFVARTIREAGVGTLLFDLLTQQEEAVDVITRHLRFDIGLLSQRLVDATHWIKTKTDTAHLRVGYFGSSTGGAAALVSAAEVGEGIGAVVSRGGRPDLAGDALPRVKSPTLLIVGELDYPVIRMNEEAFSQMRCERELKIVPGATHLFEERGTLEEVARLAAEWFQRHLVADVPA